MIEYGERTTGDRIGPLPNGQYTHTGLLDFDDVYRLHGTLTVDNDRLTFDFEGTDG